MTTCQKENKGQKLIIFIALGWTLCFELHKVNIETTIIQYFLVDLLFIISNVDIASYADDNAEYIVADIIDDLIKLLKEASTAFSNFG